MADVAATGAADATISAEEREILASMTPMVEKGSRKRKRDEMKAERGVCHSFVQQGVCRFGERCKFMHSEAPGAASAPSARDVLRQLTEERAPAYQLGNTVRPTAVGDALDSAEPDLDELDDEQREASAMESMRLAPRMTHLSMVQRYYTRLYAPDAGGERCHDEYLYLQSNRICVLGIAPSHPIFSNSDPVAAVTFAEHLMDLHVSGKKKHGVQFLEPHQEIATITTASGRKYCVRAAIRAGIIEINKRLIAQPHLVTTKVSSRQRAAFVALLSLNARCLVLLQPASAGHFAVLECKLHRILDLKQALLDQPTYERLCSLRGSSCTY